MTWIKKKLGDVLTIERGGSPRPIDKYLTNSPEGLNWIKISDATASDKYIFETKEKITTEGLHKTRMVREGDFILSNSMSFGRPYIMKTSGCIHDGWLVLKENGQKIFDTEFLYYLLSSPYVFKQFDYLAAGSTVRNLNIALVSSVEVPTPPLPEQKRIVSILDEAFAAIAKAKANAEQNLKNAKELFESYLQGVFENKGDGWDERKVTEIGNAQTGTTPKTAERENYGDFIPFIKPADVDYLGLGDIRYDNEGLSEIGLKKGRKIESGSILMVCIGATIGKVGFAEREVSCNQQINSLTVKKEFEPKFIYYAMTSKAFQEKVLLEGKGAQATLPIINKSKWENLTISFPKSKTEQQTIVRQLDALRAETQKLEAVYQKKIDDLEELKKSILQKAFAGELKTEKAISV
ncbi:MAG: restriction endonuclease subunit S [Chitinophagales bacterium]